MITINTEKELVRIESMEDIYSRPNFKRDLNPKLMVLETIIGEYKFKDKINCGLSDCHQGHNSGYLITTPEGIETNIGHMCGVKHFNVKFGDLSKAFKRDITEKENREKLKEFQHRLPKMEDRLHSLQYDEAYDANWCHKMISYLITPSKLPFPVNSKINTMRKQKTALLTIERNLTEKEKSLIQVSGSAHIPSTVTEEVSEINGFPALYEENNLKHLLIDDLAQNIKHIKSLDVDSLCFEELKRHAKWVGEVVQKFDASATIILDAKKLLTADNLKPLKRLLNKREDKQQFNSFIELLSQHSIDKAA